jgi:hypothetical protein
VARTLTTRSMPTPASVKMPTMFSQHCFVLSAMLPSIRLPLVSAGIWPETKIWGPAMMAWDCQGSVWCFPVAVCMWSGGCGKCDRVDEECQCGTDKQWSSSRRAITRVRTYIWPSSYVIMSAQFYLLSSSRLTRAGILREDLLDFRHVSSLQIE